MCVDCKYLVVVVFNLIDYVDLIFNCIVIWFCFTLIIFGCLNLLLTITVIIISPSSFILENYLCSLF